jgi:superfamily II DNA or RNA helicase/HKD family nuclease
MKTLPTGLYELLHTRALHQHLEKAGLLNNARWKEIDPEQLYQHLAVPLSREIAAYVRELLKGVRDEEVPGYLEEFLLSPGEFGEIVQAVLPVKSEILQQIVQRNIPERLNIRPDTPLSESALLTGSSRTPSLQSQLIKELATCDRADWLVSFIKFAGIQQLLPTLKTFTRTPASDGGPRLRLATTSYMGATDIKAVQVLLELPNTEIRVSLDTKRTRLHAKAYLFHRETGFSSAYVGSANVSKAALNEGLEWTAKISQYETLHLWQHAVATFDSHWEDETEFTPCTQDNFAAIAAAISLERGEEQNSDRTVPLFDVRPYGFQQIILEDIAAERAVGKLKHLIIAATGTGKTMVAAFDYRNYCAIHRGQPRLLFVAHREEILKQALASYRQVLREGSFGELLAGGNEPSSYDHLFCTVQSWNSRKLYTLSPQYYDYVVLDEAHHAPAASYQKLISHIDPKSLLGLTATPERTDGKDLRTDFGGMFTHEIRLPEAVERSLLSPFHYYGIPDLNGLDFSSLQWVRGGYNIRDLQDLLDTNDGRAEWVLSQTDKHVADIRRVRGLGFCVSIVHANFMAEKFTRSGIPSKALTGESSRELRQQIQKSLKNRDIQFIFTVDLYNEGVDIPFIDTVLFLRPTESLTLFLQQLGRGLRLHEEKAQLTVLDFIAPQNRQFDFISRFRSLSMRPDRRIDDQIKAGMPFVPAGCFIHLEKQAQEYVLDTIKQTTLNMRGARFYQEIKQMMAHGDKEISLQALLDRFHLSTPDEIYAKGLPSNVLACARGEMAAEAVQDADYSLHSGFRKMLLMDDTLLLEDAKRLLQQGSSEYETTKLLLHSLLWKKKKPDNGTLEDVQKYILGHPGIAYDLLELIEWLTHHTTPITEKTFSATGQLNLHASYTREQIVLSAGKGTFEKLYPSREGVLHVAEKKADLFFADINKQEADFSPTTMYEDYAVTDRLFHWQSQSGTGEESATGKRYINHLREGYTPYLFIRSYKKTENSLTAPYFFAGPLRYRKHQGSKPMSIIWELENPLPAKVLSWARRVG